MSKIEYKLNGEQLLKETIRRGNQTMDVKDTVAVFSGVVAERVRNLQDLIRVAGIDTKEWIVERWVCNKWEVASKLGEKEMKVQDLWQVKAWLKKNVEAITLNTIKDEVIKAMKAHSVRYPKIKYPKSGTSHLLVIDLPDLHYDKLTWAKETGEDWDIKISASIFLKTIQDLIQKASVYQVEKILFPIGNDFFNSEGATQFTTSGTPQSVDSRWKKSFLLGKKLLISAIDLLRTVAPVDVLIVPGNHDKAKTYFLGDTLESWYNKCPDVHIDNTPPLRKYYQYGACLLAYTHGKEEKLDRLPMILATEAKELFSKTKYHEWHLGDKHHKKEIKYMPTLESDGIIIRILSSLSPADQWHYEKGYLARRAGQGFVYCKNHGWVCQFNSFIS